MAPWEKQEEDEAERKCHVLTVPLAIPHPPAPLGREVEPSGGKEEAWAMGKRRWGIVLVLSLFLIIQINFHCQ